MYFPFGVRHDPTHPKAEEAIVRLEKRMQWLNECHAESQLEGHIFAAALYDYAKKIPVSNVELHHVPTVWELLMQLFSPQQIAELTRNLAPQFSDTMPRLEFPNAVALVDCRFVTTKEWEFLRRYSIGGSEVAAILGLSHYSSPRQLYYDKKGEIPDVLDIGKEFIFDFGHCVEDYVVEKACSLLGAIHYPEFRMFVHRLYPFISANPDAILMFPDGSLALFEAKTATRHKTDDWYDGIPDYYAPQPQQYLEVLDDPRLEKGYINVVFGGLPCDFKSHIYHRDRDMAAQQVRQICHFWHEYMEKDILPPLLGHAQRDLEAVYCSRFTPIKAKHYPLPEYTVDDFGLYFDLQESRKIIDDKVKELKAQESDMLAQILLKCPIEEETVCVREDGTGVKYRLRRFRAAGETVDTKALTPSVISLLHHGAQLLASPSLGYTNPKIKKGVCTK